MHAEKSRKGALDEPYVFRVRAPFESGGGPPHSKTLARWPRPLEPPPGFGVRRSCGALEFPGRFMVPMHAGKAERGLSMNRTRSAGCQPAVSPTASRRSVE